MKTPLAANKTLGQNQREREDSAPGQRVSALQRAAACSGARGRGLGGSERGCGAVQNVQLEKRGGRQVREGTSWTWSGRATPPWVSRSDPRLRAHCQSVLTRRRTPEQKDSRATASAGLHHTEMG